MEEAVDYGSDTSVPGDARTMSDTPMSEVHPPTVLGPFAERDEVIVTNPLDEQQELAVQREESARCHALMVTTLRNQRDYVFIPPSVEERLRQTTGQSLATWTIGPVAASAKEGASGQALRERYLEPSLTTQSQYKARLELQARGAPDPPIKGVPILLPAGETKDEGDNEFIRGVHRTRRLSSMYPLRASVSVADVLLERKLRYDYAKLKARGQLRNRTRYASAATVAAGAGQTVTNNPPIDTTSGGKRRRSQDDPGHDVQKHPRRMGSLAEGKSHIPMSSPTLGTLATLPDIGIGHDDVVSGASPRGTGGSLSHRAASVGVGVPKEEHEKVLLELNGLRETLGKTQSALDATQARVQALESGHTWMKAQLDLSSRWQGQLPRRKRLRVHVGRVPIRLKQANVEHRMYAQFAWKVELIRKSLLSNDREWSNEAQT